MNTLTKNFSGPGSSDPINVQRNGHGTSMHTLQLYTAGNPTGQSWALWGTTKSIEENPAYPADYFNMSGVQNGTVISVSGVPVRTVIANLASLTGGNNPSAQFGYCNSGE